MNVDILQEQHQWKLGLKSIRDIVRQVEENVTHLFYTLSILYLYTNLNVNFFQVLELRSLENTFGLSNIQNFKPQISNRTRGSKSTLTRF